MILNSFLLNDSFLGPIILFFTLIVLAGLFYISFIKNK